MGFLCKVLIFSTKAFRIICVQENSVSKLVNNRKARKQRSPIKNAGTRGVCFIKLRVAALNAEFNLIRDNQILAYSFRFSFSAVRRPGRGLSSPSEASIGLSVLLFIRVYDLKGDVKGLSVGRIFLLVFGGDDWTNESRLNT